MNFDFSILPKRLAYSKTISIMSKHHLFKSIPHDDDLIPSWYQTKRRNDVYCVSRSIVKVFFVVIATAFIAIYTSYDDLVPFSLAAVSWWISPDLYSLYSGAPQVSMKRLIQHLKALEELADNHNHSRSVANGHPATVDYVINQLSQWNDTFTYWTEDVPLSVQVDTKIPVLQLNDMTPFKHRLDFTVAQGSGSVKLDHAPVVVLAGCSPKDPSYKQDLISVMEVGTTNGTDPWVAIISNDPTGPACSICTKILYAIELGASAVITFNKPGNFEGYPTLLQPSPGYCARNPSNVERLARAGLVSLGDRSALLLLELLVAKSTSSVRVSLNIESSYKQIISKNVVAESKYGSDDSIIVFGSHLDSVPNGPGVNDDGSGAMGTLELAHAFHLSKLSRRTKSKVRFAWWTGEEIGLLGSFYYMSQVEKNQSLLQAHKLNVDTDMIGSSNFVRGLWDASTLADPELQQKCKGLQSVFARYFRAKKLPWIPFYFNGRSDFEPFLRHGIPAGGVITGEDEIKTPEQAELFGGVSGMVLDPCYHQDCDRLEQMRGPGFHVLKENMDVLAYSLGVFASSSHLDSFLMELGHLSKFSPHGQPMFFRGSKALNF